jgi:hypothetical protein
LGESFSPSLLAPLLAALERYDPDVIGVESMPPRVIADMERNGVVYGPVLDQFAADHLAWGHRSQELLDLSRTDAEEKSVALQQALSAGENRSDADSIRAELGLHLLAAYDLNSALLQFASLPEPARSANSVIPNDVTEFLAGRLREPNEIVSIGIELARRIGLPKIESIDDHQDKDLFLAIAPALMRELQDHELYASVAGSHFYTDSQARLEAAVGQGDLLPYYLYMNSSNYLTKDVDTQWNLFLRTKLDSGLDRSRLALWDVRNLNIASHIRRATALRPGKRMLVIIGASHKPFLESYLGRMADVNLIQLKDIVDHLVPVD